MVGERDPKFYSELKQINEDLLSLLKNTHEKSPYFDFSPTVKDYMDQIAELEKQYPEKSSSLPATKSSLFSTPSTPFAPVITSTSASPSAPIGSLFQAPLISQTNTSLSQAPSMQPFLFGASSNLAAPPTTTTSSTSFFSFSLPKKEDDINKSNNNVSQDTTTTVNNNNTETDDDAPPPEPNVDKYEEPDAKHSVKCKLYEKGKMVNSEVSVNLLGVGMLYVKTLDSPSKLQIIFRQEPELKRVLLNEVVTPNIPVKMLPKAVQVMFPDQERGSKFYIFKLKDESDAKTLHNMLNFVNN